MRLRLPRLRRKDAEGDNQRGATLPEYALVVSAFVAATLGVIQLLEDGAEKEIQYTSDCIGKLPGETIASGPNSGDDCQLKGTTTTSSTTFPTS